MVDLGEVLKPEAIKGLKKGQTLGFRQDDDTVQHYKIIRINKAKKTVWAEKVELYTKEEAEQIWEDVRNV